MGDCAPTRTLDDARYCIEQARMMTDSARSMWFRARESVEATKKIRTRLREQIKKLAERSPFRTQFKATLLLAILDAAIEGTGADMGNIQLFDPGTNQLVIYVHRGFHEPFLEFFNSVHSGQAACGTALKFRTRVIVPDVANSPIFSETKLLEVMLDAGVRAVQSTPIIGRSGRICGMLSTHRRTVTHPREKDLLLIDYFAARAAEILDADYSGALPPKLSVENGSDHNTHYFSSCLSE